MSSNNIERLVNCRFCANLPETGITGAPECDNWRYVKCSSGYCPLRYVLFTVDDWNGEWKGCAPAVSLPDAISVVEQYLHDELGGGTTNRNKWMRAAAFTIIDRLRSLSPGVAEGTEKLVHWQFRAGTEETICGLPARGRFTTLLADTANCPMCQSALVGYKFGRAATE